MKKEELIFIYNANSDFFSNMKDFAYKIISPKTYQCNLCNISYGNLGMKEKWKNFISNLDIKTEFLHKDEFLKKYNLRTINFPAAFIKNNKGMKLLISNEEINSCENLDELIKLVNNKLRNDKGT